MLALLAVGRLGVVVALYLALAILYMTTFRKIVLLDVAAVSGGFLLRAVAGGAAADTPLSSWFLLVTAFGSLFLVAGKRNVDLREAATSVGPTRRTLDEYSGEYLLYIKTTSSTIAIASYCLWALESPNRSDPWSGLSITPFVLAIFRYALLVERGKGGAPEEVLLHDRTLLVLGGLWVLLVGVGRYAA